MTNPVMVALDLASADEALRLARRLVPVVGAFKVGKELFTAAGPDLVRGLRGMGVPVFLDLKFHDIPNTVAGAVAAATRLEVDWMTVHASGGLEMMRVAEESARETAHGLGRSAPVVLGVTVLTSLDGAALAEVGWPGNVGALVERLAALAVRAGLRGLVCSPLELVALRQIVPEAMQLVTPGIRPGESAGDDQKRTLTPREALVAGATWLVIGRPICAAADPVGAARRILESLEARL